MKQTDPQFKFRLPLDLKEKLDAAAEKAGRALGAEIVIRLEQSFNIEPLTQAKREELMALVNEAIDERLSMSAPKPRARRQVNDRRKKR